MPCQHCPHCARPAAQPTRFVLEATWDGYKASQTRVVHRQVISRRRAKQMEKLKFIRFGDGATLSACVRPCTPREKVAEILVYSRIMDGAYYQKKEGFVDVMDIAI